MSASVHHLIVPFASTSSEAGQQALAQLQLRHLPALLDRLQQQDEVVCDEYSYSPPHEQVLAQALQWPDAQRQDGLLPWGAHTARLQGWGTEQPLAWGVVTLCHWRVHSDHITMPHPADLALTEEEAEHFFKAMYPWFAEEGLELMPLPLDKSGMVQWLVHGKMLEGLRTASIDRVCGRNVESWMPLSIHALTSPTAARAAPLQRLQSEMQMLLHRDPVNAQRAQEGKLEVNSFWVSGAGILSSEVPTFPEGDNSLRPHLLRQLAASALREDWAAWQTAWLWLDDNVFAKLLERHRNSKVDKLRITLCSEVRAHTWASEPVSLWQMLARKIRPSNTQSILGPL